MEEEVKKLTHINNLVELTVTKEEGMYHIRNSNGYYEYHIRHSNGYYEMVPVDNLEDPEAYESYLNTVRKDIYYLQQAILSIGYKSLLDALKLDNTWRNELLKRDQVTYFNYTQADVLECFPSQKQKDIQRLLANALMGELTLRDLLEVEGWFKQGS